MRKMPLNRILGSHGRQLLIIFLATTMSAGCTTKPAESNDSASVNLEYPYKIVCTIGMVSDIAREIAGDKANVTGIIGESIDPHLYQPTRDDIVAMSGADIVFYNGRLLEGKMTDTLVKISRHRPVFAVTDGIPDDRLLAPAEFAGHYDPHVWMDVSLWIQAADFCRKSLSEFDAANAADYQRNYDALLTRLQALDAYAKSTISSVPNDRRILITAHDAFNYFGRAYDIDVRGIQGISTESEAGIKDINALVKLIVSRKIAAVFVESSVSQKNVTALIEGAAAQGHDVTIGGTLFSDAMGTAGTYEGTYIGMIDHNVTTIARALGGIAPDRGLNGRLTTSTSNAKENSRGG